MARTMTFSYLIAICVLAVSNSIQAEECGVNTLLSLLIPLINDPNVEACRTASGFSFTSPLNPPNDGEVEKICATKACGDILVSLKSFNIPDCTISGFNDINFSQMVAELDEKCNNLDGGSPSPNVSPSPIISISTESPEVTTSPPTPAGSTQKPQKSKSKQKK